jgi:hypothetical protein
MAPFGTTACRVERPRSLKGGPRKILYRRGMHTIPVRGMSAYGMGSRRAQINAQRGPKPSARHHHFGEQEQRYLAVLVQGGDPNFDRSLC